MGNWAKWAAKLDDTLGRPPDAASAAAAPESVNSPVVIEPLSADPKSLASPGGTRRYLDELAAMWADDTNRVFTEAMLAGVKATYYSRGGPAPDGVTLQSGSTTAVSADAPPPATPPAESWVDFPSRSAHGETILVEPESPDDPMVDVAVVVCDSISDPNNPLPKTIRVRASRVAALRAAADEIFHRLQSPRTEVSVSRRSATPDSPGVPPFAKPSGYWGHQFFPGWNDTPRGSPLADVVYYQWWLRETMRESYEKLSLAYAPPFAERERDALRAKTKLLATKAVTTRGYFFCEDLPDFVPPAPTPTPAPTEDVTRAEEEPRPILVSRGSSSGDEAGRTA